MFLKTIRRGCRFQLCLISLALAATSLLAQTVLLPGLLGKNALLVIDGGAPQSVPVGGSFQGVKVVSIAADQAVVEIGGKRQTLRVWDVPASVGGVTTSAKIVLYASSGGHFIHQGTVNGRVLDLMVDTGATYVTLCESDAQQLGLNYRDAQQVRLITANGSIQAWRMNLSSIRLGEVEVHEVDALVSPLAMPYVLLGNSFLNRFQMKRENDQMTLERR